MGSVFAGLGEVLGLSLPTLRWGFNVSREIEWLHWGSDTGAFLWFGWLGVVMGFVFGLLILWKFPRDFAFTPITQRRIDRFPLDQAWSPCSVDPWLSGLDCVTGSSGGG